MGAILILCVMHLEGIHICTRILSDGGSLTQNGLSMKLMYILYWMLYVAVSAPKA